MIAHLVHLGLFQLGTAFDGSSTGIVAYLTVFALAAFVGIEVVSKVPSILHTPLMSGSNAIHGIVLVGALTIMGEAHGAAELVLGTLAVFLATLNIVGGFVVTDRMLEMFKSKPGERPAKAKATEPAAKAQARGDRRGVRPGRRRGCRLMLAATFTLSDARDLAYLVAIIGFILALKLLSSPKHAREGNLIGAAAAILAVGFTFTEPGLRHSGKNLGAGPRGHGPRRSSSRCRWPAS